MRLRAVICSCADPLFRLAYAEYSMDVDEKRIAASNSMVGEYHFFPVSWESISKLSSPDR